MRHARQTSIRRVGFSIALGCVLPACGVQIRSETPPDTHRISYGTSYAIADCTEPTQEQICDLLTARVEYALLKLGRLSRNSDPDVQVFIHIDAVRDVGTATRVVTGVLSGTERVDARIIVQDPTTSEQIGSANYSAYNSSGVDFTARDFASILAGQIVVFLVGEKGR